MGAVMGRGVPRVGQRAARARITNMRQWIELAWLIGSLALIDAPETRAWGAWGIGCLMGYTFDSALGVRREQRALMRLERTIEQLRQGPSGAMYREQHFGPSGERL